ncbi:PQQ-binding-like beta-propeller repeat protein, partial [Bacteroidota bacterium]
MIKNIIFLLIPLILLLSCADKKETEKGVIDLESVSWPIFRGDQGLSGVADCELPDNLKLLWSFQTESAIVSSPAIGFGLVYIGSTDGKLYAVSLADGSKVWEYDTGDDIEASPLIVGRNIYIGNLSGELFSINARTGQVNWKNKIMRDIYGSTNFAVGPDSQDTLLFVGSYDNQMYCLDAKSGELIWTYETDNYINGAPATDGSTIIFGGCDSKLHIVSAIDGSKVGEVLTDSYIPGSAVLAEGRAYLGHYGNKLICIDVDKQEIVWEF